MDNDASKSLYSEGFYLHRLYLAENPLLHEYSDGGKIDAAKKAVEKQIELLRQKEDMALANLASAFLGPDNGTPENGMKFLQDFVTGDGKEMLDSIINSFVEAHENKTDEFIYDKATQEKIIQNAINFLEGKFNGLGEKELNKSAEDWKNKLEESLGEIEFQKNKDGVITDRPFQTLEGEFFERMIPAYFNLAFENVMKGQQQDFNRYVELDAEFTGQQPVENAVAALNKKKPYDVNIRFNIDDVISYLPIQIKAKPTSNKQEINLYSHMNIINLINTSLDAGQRKALQTAIINQHYWSQGWYRNKVDAVAEKLGYDIGFAGRGHPTAIERLDESTTLEPIRGVIPLMRYAIIYNLITGIDNVTDQLIYVIVGKSKTTAVLRSSEILSDIINDIMYLGISGHGVGKRVSKKNEDIKVPEFTDSSVNGLYGKVTRRPEWYKAIEPKMNSMLSKIAITVTLNYSTK